MKKLILFILLMLAFTAFGQLPQPTLTGTPNFNVINMVYDFQNTDVVFVYYVDNDTARLSNSTQLVNGSGIVAGQMSTVGDAYDNQYKKNGFAFGQEVYLGVFRDGKAYKVNVDEVKTTSGEIKPWKFYPMDLLLITNVDITDEVFEVYPTQSQEYILAQCPKFFTDYGGTIERDWTSKKIYPKYKWINGVKTKVGNYYYDNKSLSLSWTPVQYHKEKIWEVFEGDGQVVGRNYKTTKSDHDRGYVIFKFTAIPLPNCPLETNPYIYVKYNFIVPPMPK